jgi:hypothetical protein
MLASASPASVPDDTEVVPPKSQKQSHRPSMPLPLIDDEPNNHGQLTLFQEAQLAELRLFCVPRLACGSVARRVSF